MSSRARSLLLSRITGQALAATGAGAFGAPTGALFRSCALFHDAANLHLTRLGAAVAVSPPVGNQDRQLCRTPLHDATEHREQLLLSVADLAAAPVTSATLCSVRHSPVPCPLHQESWRLSFASQAGSSCGDASSKGRRQQTDASPATPNNSAKEDPAHSPSGWTRREVWNVPNAISMARLISGPVIAYWIVTGKTDAALLGLVISGWSDWLDGFVARRLNQQSTLGSYLDPLADKVLICSVVAALGIQGTLPGYLAAAIIGRDIFLIVASFTARARSLGWRRVSIAEFFRIVPKHQQGTSSAASDVQGAGAVTPLYFSKLNTVFQLATVAGFLLHAHAGWPPLAVLDTAAVVTTGTTVLSGAAYVHAFRTQHP